MRSLLHLCLCLILAGCGGTPKIQSEGEIEDIAHDAAIDATNGKFSDLEGRISDLETAVAGAEAKASDAESRASSAKTEVEYLESRLDLLRAEYESHTH